MEEILFKVQNEEGQDILCKTVLTFDTDDHSYVLFSIIDEDGVESEELSALRYELNENGEMTNFSPIETEEEWEIIEEVFNTLEGEVTDNKDFFTIELDDGEEKVCKVLHRFTIEGYEKNYMFYALVDDENEEIFAASFLQNEEGHVEDILPIETEEEWEKVEEVLQNLTRN